MPNQHCAELGSWVRNPPGEAAEGESDLLAAAGFAVQGGGGRSLEWLLTEQPALWSEAGCALSSLLIQVFLGCHLTVISQSQVGFPPNLTFIALIST